MAIFAKRLLAALFTVASLGLPATADSFSASAGVYKFQNTSEDPLWRVQKQATSSTKASAIANWDMPANEWGTEAGAVASATAEPGRVKTTGGATTTYPSGGTTASGSAWTDDFLVQHRDGLTDPGYVAGYLRITVTFETTIDLTDILPFNTIFNAARIDWSVLTRDMIDSTASGWAVSVGDGTNHGSPWPVVGKKFYDIPVSFAVGRTMAVNLSLSNDVQVLSNSGGVATVMWLGMLELGHSPDNAPKCSKSAAARLAVILPPEYRADSVKWGIVDGMYTPPGAVPCPADLDDSGTVDTGDIALLLLSFGDCDSGAPGCSGDLDDSGSVDTGDIAMLLLDMGPCP